MLVHAEFQRNHLAEASQVPSVHDIAERVVVAQLDQFSDLRKDELAQHRVTTLSPGFAGQTPAGGFRSIKSRMQARSGDTASIPIRHPERMDAKVPVNQNGPRGTSPKCAASSLRPRFLVMAEAASRRKVRSLDSRESASA